MYRIAGFAVTMAAAGVLAISPALAQQSQQTGTTGQQPAGTQARVEKLTSSERQDLRSGAEASLAQIEYSRLAQQRAQSNDVKQFANQIVDRRTRMLTDLRDFASRHNVTLPSQVSSKDRREVDRLSKLSGADFDREYLKAIEDHQNQRIAAWQRISQQTKNEDLKQFATNTVLPQLQEQQNMVHQQMAALGITPSAPMTDEQQQMQKPKTKGTKHKTY